MSLFLCVRCSGRNYKFSSLLLGKTLSNVVHFVQTLTNMKQRLFLVLYTLTLALLTGCLTPDRLMKSYMGKPSTELVARWGLPQQKMSDGQGGEIWIYLERRQWTTPGQANTVLTGTGNTYGDIYGTPYGAAYQANTSFQGSATTTYTPAQTHGYTAQRTFFINGSGIVYRYAWRGL